MKNYIRYWFNVPEAYWYSLLSAYGVKPVNPFWGGDIFHAKKNML